MKLGLEGEKEFKSAIKDINDSMKVLGSEMTLVASQFDKHDKSEQAVTARSTVLSKEIESQKEKIETLRAALSNASESFGENDRRTQQWQIQLNKAQAELNGIRSISDERIIGQWISTDSTMSHGHTLDFYDGGIGEELVKIGGERTEFGFEWYAAGDKVLVDTGTEKEIYTYGKDEYGEIHMINETKDLELFKQ